MTWSSDRAGHTIGGWGISADRGPSAWSDTELLGRVLASVRG